MPESMPVGDFTCQMFNKTSQEILTTSDDSSEGCFAMIGIHYHHTLHDKHNYLPSAAEKMQTQHDLHSKIRKKLKHLESKSEKLLETRFGKMYYVCHYSLFKIYVERGLKKHFNFISSVFKISLPKTLE